MPISGKLENSSFRGIHLDGFGGGEICGESEDFADAE
jgi:hypothetical protein